MYLVRRCPADIGRIGGLDDPTGKDDECFLEVIHSIEKKVFELKRSVEMDYCSHAKQ